MNLFAEPTELEKVYKALTKAIKNDGSISPEVKKYFLEYVAGIKAGVRSNDFFNFEFLGDVMLQCLESEDPIKEFEEMKRTTRTLLPLGEETEDYKLIKNTILSGNTYINQMLYALFGNVSDYMLFMNIIKKDSIFKEHYEDIVNYAIDVSPYCMNQEELKREVLAFINGLKNELGDVSSYVKKRLEDAKKKCGIYPIDEKTLTLIAGEVRKANNILDMLSSMKTQVERHREAIDSLTQAGKQELEDYASKKVLEMQENIERVEASIRKKLEEFLITLEKELRDDKKEIFDAILKEARDQLGDIKLSIKSLTSTTTSELLRIQKASEASLASMKKYMENEPELRQLLKETLNIEQVKEILVKYEELRSSLGENASAPNVVGVNPNVVGVPNIIIPGSERVVIPANARIILPTDEISYDILPAFDESIPFDVRMNKVLDEKAKRENEGEIFHELTDEVLRCVIEGDWVYLYGPSGSGKSRLMRQVASLLGLDYVENGKITDKYSIMAYNDPHGRFRATQAFIALTYGKMLALDEFDNGNPDTQVVLNEIYSGLLDTVECPEQERFITFAEDMNARVNPNFRMISAGNTSGEGENEVFSSRGKIDESVLERMTPKRFDYDDRLEEKIFGEYQSWYKFFVNFRKACEKYAKSNGLTSAPGIVTSRDASAIVKYIHHNSKTLDQVLMEKFVQTKNPDYLSAIIGYMEQVYQIPRNDSGIDYNELSGKVSEEVLAKKLIQNCRNASRVNGR